MRNRGLFRRVARLPWVRPLMSIAVLCLHCVFSHKDYRLLEAFFAGICGAITLDVIWMYFKRAKQELPVLGLILLQIYVYFAMPVFFEGLSTPTASFQSLSRDGAILEALIATNLLVLSLLLGWKLVRGWKIKSQTKVAPHIAPIFLLIYGMATILASIFLYKHEWETKVEWYSSVLSFMFSPVSAQAIMLFEVIKSPSSTSAWWRMWVFTGIMVFFGILSGRLDYAMAPILTLVVGLIAVGKRVPKSLIIGSIIMILILNPAKYIYRELTGYRTPEFSSMTFGKMVDAWLESVNQVWSGDYRADGQLLKVTTARLNFLSINAAVINTVPKIVPYAMGEPWLAVPISLIPRFLWPDKPNITEITNDAFGNKFGMTTKRTAERTTGAYPILADSFWNFGWSGVIIIGFLVGILWKIVFLVWASTSRFRYVVTIVLLVNIRLVNAISGQLIGMFQTIVASFIVIVVMETSSRILRKTGT